MIHQRLYRSGFVGANFVGPNGEVLPEHKPVLHDLSNPKGINEHVGAARLPIEHHPLLLGGQEGCGDGGEKHAPVWQLVDESPRSMRK